MESRESENQKKRKINEENERSDKIPKIYNQETNLTNRSSTSSDQSINQPSEINQNNQNIDFKFLINSLTQLEEIKRNKKIYKEEQINYDQMSRISSSQCNQLKCKCNEMAHSPSLISPPSSATSSSSSSDIHSPNSFQNTFQSFGQNSQFGDSSSPVSYYEDSQPRINSNSSSNFYPVPPFEFASNIANSAKNVNTAFNDSKQAWNSSNDSLRENVISANNMYYAEQARQFDIRKKDCCLTPNLCEHKKELQILRRNIFTAEYFTSENFSCSLIAMHVSCLETISVNF